MKYMLDTNACIRFLKGDSPGLLKNINAVTQNQIGVSSVVCFELYYGAYKSMRVNETIEKLNRFLGLFTIVPVAEETSIIAGRIRAQLEKKGTPIGPYDLLIAASALEYSCTLVSHNTKEFLRIEELALADWEL